MSTRIKKRSSSTYSEDLSRYEFVDYTAASDFEKCVTQLEEILMHWTRSSSPHGPEQVMMGDDVFELIYHHHSTSSTNSSLSFPDFYQHSQHPIHRWTGLDRFILFRPLQDSFRLVSQASLSQAKLWMSACAVAVHHVGCQVPVFVPVGQYRHDLYLGYGRYPSLDLRFDMTLIPSTSPLNSWEGLRALFIQNLTRQQDEQGSNSPVQMTTVLTYNLKTWFDERWKEWDLPVPKRRISFSDDFDDWPIHHHHLPFGSFNDPLRSLTLCAVFPLTEDLPEEPMDALTATEWHLAREFAQEHQQRAYLADTLTLAVQSWIQDPANQTYLAPYDESNDDSATSDRVRHLFSKDEPHKVTLVKSDTVEAILVQLFSDQEEQWPKPDLRLEGAVPVGSLLWYMVFYSLKAMEEDDQPNRRRIQRRRNQQTEWISMLQIVWTEVVRKIRWHWENNRPLPHVSPYLYEETDSLGIDLRYPLVHQKLCMIQCCLSRQREDESDVFLDAISDEMDDAFISVASEPEGQLGPHPSLTLLQTGQPMQVPKTQDPGFMTEDMVHEQAGMFERLGSSDSATQQRARLQSAQLVSDMQAFKAANPRACLEDFVRWHSPKDWIDDQLSARMAEPNTLWQELWRTSKPIPCARQSPLFDVQREAERALCYLETLSVQDLFAILLPTCGLIAYDTLFKHPVVHYSERVKQGLTELGQQLVQFPWQDVRHGKQSLDPILQSIRYQENRMCYAISLVRKLPYQFRLVDQLLEHHQAKVHEGQERSTVFELFKNDENTMSEPSYKEYVFYSHQQRRQYALVKDNEIRLVDMQIHE